MRICMRMSTFMYDLHRIEKDHRRFKGEIMKLKKALYGLRQAPRRWYTTLTNAMVANGLTCSRKDLCVMYYRNGDLKINNAMQVDDIVMATTDSTRFMSWFEGTKFER